MSADGAAPAADVARRLGISTEAVALMREADAVDLHIDTFIPPRLWGYDLARRHGLGLLRGSYFGHLDFHRVREAGLAGAVWSITTNPLRTPRGRWRALLRNIERMRAAVDRTGGRLRVVRTHSEFLSARRAGAHACLLAIQGGNALTAAPAGPASIPDGAVTRVTLVHLTDSELGVTSSPLRRSSRFGLTPRGRALVEALNAQRVFVDLAHVHATAFWDAHDAHDRTQPLLATHTGVCGVTPHWRNLDDRQLRAVADTGGVIGIMFQRSFLARPDGPRDGAMVVEHMEHAVRVAGEDHVAVGSDYDGAIVPPDDLRDGAHYPRLVQHMLDRGWPPDRVRKVLGGNFLRVLAELRP